MKRIVFILYVLILIILATATIVEHFIGTPAAHDYIYGSWWFISLWALLVVFGIGYIFNRFRRRPITLRWLNTLLLHFSFVVILIGAFITHATSSQGIIYLRGDQPTNRYEEMGNDEKSLTLPFYVRLDKFHVDYHEGTTSPIDYETHFAIMDGPKTIHATVSMNKIFTYRHYRLYQASYDTDNMGSYLSVNRDPWGIAVSYSGYGLLFLSLLMMLVVPGSPFRKLLRSPLLRKGLFMLSLLMGLSSASLAQESQQAQSLLKHTQVSNLQDKEVLAPVVSEDVARQFGNLFISYNGRICPVETFAIDFTQKIHGQRKYGGLNACQVLTSWIFYPSEWANEPFIHVKNKKLRNRFHLSENTSLKSFFDNGYILGPLLEEYRDGQHDDLHKAAVDIDGRLQLLMSLRDGSSLVMMPHKEKGDVRWYSPADNLPTSMPHVERLFVRNIFPILYQSLASGKKAQTLHILSQWKTYQQKNGAASLPTSLQVKAEKVYNAVPVASILFMVNLLMGIICMEAIIRKMGMRKSSFHGLSFRWTVRLTQLLLLLSWLALSLTIVLRGIIMNAAPLANGYDTMLFMAWIVMLVMLIVTFAVRSMSMLACAFGFLLSGFFLLVSHLNVMDPSIGHLMPVLRSPLLSIHVSIIMFSFALLALNFVCGVTGLLMREHERELQVLSLLFLYPALTTLGLGIFIGAIWANVSWGNYWTWDPKETWALITFMVYAVAVHRESVRQLSRPHTYHWFTTLAFLTLVMTYFGVNFFLQGMHSYA